MKKILISLAFITAFGGYVYYSQASSVPIAIGAPLSPVATDATTTSGISASAPPTKAPITSVAVAPSVTPVVKKPTPVVTTGEYGDGTYRGSAADAYYGNIQVVATISGGKLTDVTFLQYPNDRRESISINQRAMPQLRAEAISAQSANVNGVSGASDSSAAFRESLGNALLQAKA